MKNDTPPIHRFHSSLLELARHRSISNVFADFLDFSLLMLKWWDLKGEYFSDLEVKYPTQNEQRLFAVAYYAMSEVADNEGTGFKDPFGDFYMEHMSNGRNGQFFTPEPVCEMIASVQIGPTIEDGATIADPCCGSGRLILSAAKRNRKALFYAADIDLVCCKMTAINFLLNTICGEVAWMNTLSMEHWKSWYIKKVMASNGIYLPYYTEKKIENTEPSPSKENMQNSPIKEVVKKKILSNTKISRPGQLQFHFE